MTETEGPLQTAWSERPLRVAGKVAEQAGFVRTLVGTGALPLMRPATMAKAVGLPDVGDDAGGVGRAGRPAPPRRRWAIVDERRRLTYGEVHRRTNAIAHGLQAQASSRATAWRSCAATTAASSRPRWRPRSSAPTPSTSTPTSPARSCARSRARGRTLRHPRRGVHRARRGDAFARPRAFVGLADDDERPRRRPHPRRADRRGDAATPPRAARAARPHSS